MRTLLGVFCGLLLGATALGQALLGSGFTYQGELRQSGQPYTGSADFRFRLFDAATLGQLVAGPFVSAGVPVVGGRFTTAVDLGAGVFDGNARWLEVAVATPSGSGTYTTLSPRQPVNAAPYAFFSARPWQTSGSTLSYAGGDVGVGPEVPSHRLTISGNNNTLRLIGTGAYGSGGSLNFGDGTFVTLREDVDDSLLIQTTSRGRVAVTGGPVGIGTFAPTANLHVSSNQGRALFVESTDGFAAEPAVHVEGLRANGAAVRVRNGDEPPSNENVAELATHMNDALIGGFQAVGALGKANGVGLYGYSTAHDRTGFGVVAYQQAVPADPGLFQAGLLAVNQTTSGYPYTYAIYALGRMAVTGTKSFQIDHPLDPPNKVLIHYCAEGPEPLNVYRGRVTLDEGGRAIVQLPDYFAAINRDPTYQLTPMGAAAPDLHVAREITDNRFEIAGGAPGQEICWRVEAVRNDPFVRDSGAPVELDKPEPLRGTLLYGGTPAE